MMLRRIFPANHSSAIIAAATTTTSFAVRFCSQQKGGDYSLEDFVNEIDDENEVTAMRLNLSLKKSLPPAAQILKNSKLRVIQKQQHREQQQQQQQNSSSSVTKTAAAAATVHSLSEFLVRCNENVKSAKQHPGDAQRRKRAEAFWNKYVASAVEMNVRNGHDLACVARAGRGFRFTIPQQQEQQQQQQQQQQKSAATCQATYVGWSIMSRNEHFTGCSDSMAALALLVRSQPPFDRATSPNAAALQSLAAGHQKFALQCIEKFFVPQPSEPSQQQQQPAAAAKEWKNVIRCPVNDFESIVDALEILVGLFTKQQQQQQQTPSLMSWPLPPLQIRARHWQLVAAVYNDAVVACAVSLSFSQIVSCISMSQKLFASAGTALRDAERATAQMHQKMNHQEQQHFADGKPQHQHQQQERVKTGMLQKSRKLGTASHSARDAIRRGTSALLDLVVEQSQTSREIARRDKLVNSHHFTEVLFAADSMNLLAGKPNLKALLSETFEARCRSSNNTPSASGAGSGAKWNFSVDLERKIAKILVS